MKKIFTIFEKILAIIGTILRSTLGLYVVAWGILFGFFLTNPEVDKSNLDDIFGTLFTSGVFAFPFAIFIAFFTIPFFQLKDELERKRDIRKAQKKE